MFQGDDTKARAAFTRAAKHSWIQALAIRANNFHQRPVNMAFDKAMESVQADYPGESYAKVRKHLKELGRWWPAAQAQATLDPPPAELAEDSEEADHRPDPAEDADPRLNKFTIFLDDLANGTNLNYACRYKQTKSFVPRDTWVKRSDLYQCPGCTHKYHP